VEIGKGIGDVLGDAAAAIEELTSPWVAGTRAGLSAARSAASSALGALGGLAAGGKEKSSAEPGADGEAAARGESEGSAEPQSGAAAERRRKAREAEFDRRRREESWAALRTNCSAAILGPFGLGRLVALGDKDGGNVTTLHGFKQGIVASEADRRRYDAWPKDGTFDGSRYRSGLSDERRHRFQDPESLVDGYTGKRLTRDGRTHIDHIIPIRKIARDPKNDLYDVDRDALANHGDNRTYADASLNHSKGDRDLDKWAQSSAAGGKTNSERFALDPARVSEQSARARRHERSTQLRHQLRKQGPEILGSGLLEGTKLGTQQALALVLHEFVDALCDQLEDVCRHGLQGESDARFLAVLKLRLSQVAQKVAARWEGVCGAFGKGLLFGFLSNLITVFVNLFATTGKRAVRMIREGVSSVGQAAWMLCFPPEGLTLAQTAHAASKVAAAGLVITATLLVEQQLEALLAAVPLLGALAAPLTSVLAGCLAAVLTALLGHALDRIDLLGVIEAERRAFALECPQGAC
jgi:hypothetical protein